MAREKTKVRMFKMPSEAPASMVFEDVKRTIGKESNQVVRVLVPEISNAGVLAGVAYLSGILEGDNQGPAFAAEAIRNAMVTSQIAQAGSNGTAAAEAGNIVPRIAKLTTVDKGAVAGAKLQAFIAEHGRAPSQSEYKDIYAGLSL